VGLRVIPAFKDALAGENRGRLNPCFNEGFDDFKVAHEATRKVEEMILGTRPVGVNGSAP